MTAPYHIKLSVLPIDFVGKFSSVSCNGYCYGNLLTNVVLWLSAGIWKPATRGSIHGTCNIFFLFFLLLLFSSFFSSLVFLSSFHSLFCTGYIVHQMSSFWTMSDNFEWPIVHHKSSFWAIFDHFAWAKKSIKSTSGHFGPFWNILYRM